MTGGEHYAREHFDRWCTEHGSIYAAIADGDGPSSSAAMRSHLANSRRRLRAALPATADAGSARQRAKSLKVSGDANMCWTGITAAE